MELCTTGYESDKIVVYAFDRRVRPIDLRAFPFAWRTV